jgi:soluble lytic murein transglycosylase-like protein
MRPLFPLVLASLLPLAPAAGAGSVVDFADGRSLEVAGVEQVGEMVHLTLEGGGVLAVPLTRVLGWIGRATPADEADAAPVAAPPAEGPEAWRLAAGPYAEMIGTAAARHDLDPVLLTAVAAVESAFDPNAVSSAGACGLMQLMPRTAERFGVGDVFDAEQNVEGGARYLRWLLERFEGDPELALAGYNAGEGAVERHRGVPPYRETRGYVSRVLEGAGRLSQIAP